MFFQLIIAAAVIAPSGSDPHRCTPVLPGWTAPSSGKLPYVLWNTVSVRKRQIHWNGVRISQPTLTSYVRRSAEMSPVPILVFDPDYKDCWFDRRIQKVLERSYPCRSGICFQGSPDAFRARSMEERARHSGVMSVLGRKRTFRLDVWSGWNADIRLAHAEEQEEAECCNPRNGESGESAPQARCCFPQGDKHRSRAKEEEHHLEAQASGVGLA